ncbi:hypothetical protein GRJ2_000204700 [Grus japonensis]|uniref:Uncharacterized protein n=1 Tax=Grus japonensis TaxID=30415 RepID=A0ABC9VVY6_GRUJA
MRVTEVPYDFRVRTRAYECEATPIEDPMEGLIRSVFLVDWPVADPHYDVPCACPSFNPDPEALGRLLIHPQVELHALELVIDLEDDSPPHLP